MRSRSRSPPLGSDVGGAGLARARRETREQSPDRGAGRNEDAKVFVGGLASSTTSEDVKK